MTPGGEPIFEVDGDRYLPTDHARGPWDRGALHGGAPAALMATLLEELAPEHALTRLTVEFVRPVPKAPLSVSTAMLRAGRQVQRTEAVMHAGDMEVARALGVHLRRKALPAGPAAQATIRPGEDLPPGRAEADAWVDPPGADYPGFHNSGMEVVFATGHLLEPGPAVAWFRFGRPLLAGGAPSAMALAAAACDFGNGIASIFDWSTHTFINPELTVYLLRPPVGEWIGLDAVTRASAGDGLGLAEGRIFDEEGIIGRSQQSVLFEALAQRG